MAPLLRRLTIFSGQQQGGGVYCRDVEKHGLQVGNDDYRTESYWKNVAGPVAQRLEQWTHNPLVVGSNPTGPSLILSVVRVRRFTGIVTMRLPRRPRHRRVCDFGLIAMTPENLRLSLRVRPRRKAISSPFNSEIYETRQEGDSGTLFVLLFLCTDYPPRSCCRLCRLAEPRASPSASVWFCVRLFPVPYAPGSLLPDVRRISLCVNCLAFGPE